MFRADPSAAQVSLTWMPPSSRGSRSANAIRCSSAPSFSTFSTNPTSPTRIPLFSRAMVAARARIGSLAPQAASAHRRDRLPRRPLHRGKFSSPSSSCSDESKHVLIVEGCHHEVRARGPRRAPLAREHSRVQKSRARWWGTRKGEKQKSRSLGPASFLRALPSKPPPTPTRIA
jgi:hypothetical protein